MTDVIQRSPLPDADERSRSLERWCLNGSLILSSLSILVGVIGWWLVRFANVTAAEEGGRVRDLLNIDWESSPLPLLLFVIFMIPVVTVANSLVTAGIWGSGD